MKSQLSITKLSFNRIFSQEENGEIAYEISFENLLSPSKNQFKKKILIDVKKRSRIVNKFKKIYRPSSKVKRKQGSTRGVSADLRTEKEDIETLGRGLYKTFLSDASVRSQLHSLSSEYIQINTNDPEIPWELMFPHSLEGVLGKKFAVSNRISTESSWLQTIIENEKSRKEENTKTDDSSVKILFIADPKPGPEIQKKYGINIYDEKLSHSFTDEIENIKNELIRKGLIDKDSVVFLSGEKASSYSIQHHLTENSFDILHFAGHSVFHPDDPSESGLILSDGLLTPDNLREKMEGKCPPIIFLNSCVSAVTTSFEEGRVLAPNSLLEGFCGAGAQAIVGTLWEPDTYEAQEFSVGLYSQFLESYPIGKALQETKKELSSKNPKSISWACYALYGDPGYQLPRPKTKKKPFKILDRYYENDTDIYFGRNENKESFLQKLEHCPILTVTGVSGVGKSSFLRAAVLPNLKEWGYLVSIVDVGYLDPIPRVIQNIQDQITTEESSSIPEKPCLKEFLLSNSSIIKRPLVIIFDQFERFLIDLENKETRDRVMQDILHCVDSIKDIKVRFVFTLRVDYWADLNGYLKKGHWANHNCETLNFFDEEEAKEIIEKPLNLFGVKLDKDLMASIITDLKKTPEVTGHGNRNLIFPPYLQILCNNLYGKALKKNRDGSGNLHLSLEDYESEDSITLIKKHLHGAISRLGERGPLGNIILKELSSEEGLVISSEDVGQDQAFKGKIQAEGYSLKDIEIVLESLFDERLVLWNANKYQLVHDCIARIIVDSMSEKERAIKEIKSRISRSKDIWLAEGKKHQKLFNAGVLDEIIPYLNEVKNLGSEGYEFLVKSAVWNDDELFLGQLLSQETKVDIGLIFSWVSELAESEDNDVEAYALKALGKIESKDSEAYLIENILATEEDKFIEIGISSLAKNDRIDGLKKLIKKSTEKSKNRIKILALLKEDYCEGPDIQKRLLYEKLLKETPITLYQSIISVRLQIWKTRYSRVKSEHEVLKKYSTLGAIWGLAVGLIAAAVPLITRSSLIYGYYASRGEGFAFFKIYIEGCIIAVVGGLFIFPLVRGLDIFCKSKSHFQKILYGTVGSLFISIPFGLVFFCDLMAQVYGPNKETFESSLMLGTALSLIAIATYSGMAGGLMLCLERDGTRRPIKSTISCVCSLSFCMFLYWLAISMNRGSLFINGKHTTTLDDGSTINLLSYSDWSLFGEIGRFGLWAIGACAVYIYYYTREMSPINNK